jgi:hypothetical protein
MYTINLFYFILLFILFFHLVAPKGGCPSPRAYGAYPQPALLIDIGIPLFLCLFLQTPITETFSILFLLQNQRERKKFKIPK